MLDPLMHLSSNIFIYLLKVPHWVSFYLHLPYFIFKKDLLFLIMCMHVLLGRYIYVGTGALRGQRRCWIPWCWGSLKLGLQTVMSFAIWVLGT